MTNHVQSGSARTALDDDETDYYPVRLERKALRPGTIYADPYGHVMMIVKWVEQTTDARRPPARRRRAARHLGGTQALLGGDVPVHQRHEERRARVQGVPAARARRHGRARAPCATRRSAAPAIRRTRRSRTSRASSRPTRSTRAWASSSTRRGSTPTAAYGETLDALVEQLKVRVGSVDNGEKFMRENANPVVPDARRREDLRDDGAVGGLRDAVARHAPHHRDERAARAPRPDRAAPRALQAGRPQARGGRRRAAQAARRARRRRAASSTSAATARRSS